MLSDIKKNEPQVGPLQSFYLEDRFGDTFSYIDNMMNTFFKEYTGSDADLKEARSELNASYEAKLASLVKSRHMRKIITQDYTTRFNAVDENG